MYRMSWDTLIAAVFSAGVRFTSTEGRSVSGACGTSYPLVGEATGVGDMDVQPGPANFLRVSSAIAVARWRSYCFCQDTAISGSSIMPARPKLRWYPEMNTIDAANIRSGTFIEIQVDVLPEDSDAGRIVPMISTL